MPSCSTSGPARTSPRGPTMVDRPRLSQSSSPPYSSSRPGRSAGTSEPRSSGATPITYIRPSLARWRRVGTPTSLVSEGGPHPGEGGALAHAPDQPLAPGGHELAVLGGHGTVGAEVQLGVVEGAAGRGVENATF